jgi:hypothetical protein
MESTMTYRQNARDEQTPKAGKAENDKNKLGQAPTTQLNQGKRTTDSRSDRESHIGSGNQTQSRSQKH